MLTQVLSLALLGAAAAAPTGDDFCDALSRAENIFQPCNVVKYVAMQAQMAFPMMNANAVIGIFEFGGKMDNAVAQTHEEAFLMIHELITAVSRTLPRNANSAEILEFSKKWLIEN